MPLLNSISGSAAEGYGFVIDYHRLFSDTFNRSNSVSGLGVSSNGEAWISVAGNWYTNGSNQAQSSYTSYPLSIVYAGSTKQKVGATVSDGTGVAAWVTLDGNNWVAATVYSTVSIYVCGSYSCNCVGTGCTTTYTCNPVTTNYSCNCYWQLSNYICQTCQTTTDTGCPSTTCTGQSCSTCYSYCGSTSYYLRLTQNQNGTVTIPVSDISLSGAPSSISISTFSGSVVYSAYSDYLSTAIATSTYSPSGQTAGGYVGVIQTPSYSSSGTVANFTASIK
jgi:hypothetical protein